MDCRLGDGNVLQPDAFCVAPENLGIIHDHILGSPDLVVEVLSRGTRRFDRTQKLETYAPPNRMGESSRRSAVQRA